MKITEISIKKPVGTTLLVFTLIVLGILSIPKIPISFWPEFVAPTLIVMAPYPGTSPSEIEELIAKPLEEELSTIDGVDEIETAALEGICRVSVRFRWGINFKDAKQDVQDRTNKARARFPRDAAAPSVLQVQDFLPPGIELGFFSEKRGLNEIREFVETKLKNRFLRLNEVANVKIFGGEEEHIVVRLNPNRLSAYGLSPGQINSVLISENMNVPAGKISTEHRNYYVRTVGKFQRIRDIEKIIVASANGVPIQINDIASVQLENKEKKSIIRQNGKEIVGLSIREKSGGNTVAMVEEVKRELEKIRLILPADLQMTILRDQATFIQASIFNVLRNAMFGAGLASLVLLLFLGNFRNTLIIGLSIPISFIGTFVLIDAFGLSINTISLGGLALGVGMIVDSSIVVLENIFRNLQKKPDDDRLNTIVQATKEVGMAVTASNLTSIVVFLPLAFLVGLFAVLLGELALTVVFALSISVIVALTVIPALSYKLMETGNNIGLVARTWQNMFEALVNFYRAVIRRAIRHRLITIFAAFILLIASVYFVTPHLDVELLPSINEGEFKVELILPESTQLQLTNEMSGSIENQLKQWEEIEQVYSVVGVQSVRGELKPNFATLTVRLKKTYLLKLSAVMERVRQNFTEYPGVQIIVRQTDATVGMKRPAINVRISGDNLKILGEIGGRVLEVVGAIPNVVNLNSSLKGGLYEFNIRVDRSKTSALGLTSSQIASSIRIANLGISNTRLSSFGEEYDITLKIDDQQIQSVNDLLDLPLTTGRGQIVPLSAVAKISLERGPSEIKRFDQQRVLEVIGDVAGRSQREVVAEIKQKVDALNLPPNYYISYGGQSRGIADSFKSLVTALIIAIFLVYVVMGSQFNSFIHPFTIALTIPLALIGVVIGLFVFSAAISMNALLGMIMLVGIVVNNGILLIDSINQLREQGIGKEEAIITGGALRLRPVLITSLTTIFAMLPIALGFGEGSEALQPLGAVVVGGLGTSTFLTLIVIPCVYSLLDRKKA